MVPLLYINPPSNHLRSRILSELKLGSGTKFRKSDWYSVFQGYRKFDLFAEQDEGIHTSQRRLISCIYAMDSLKDLESYVQNAVFDFLTHLYEMQGRKIGLGVRFQLFAFGNHLNSPLSPTRTDFLDVIGEITFSRRFGFMDAQKDDVTIQRIKDTLQSGSWISQVPWLYWLHDRIMSVIEKLLAINVRHGRLRNFGVHEMKNRKDQGSDHHDILSKLFDVQRDKPKELSEADVTSMAASNIIAAAIQQRFLCARSSTTYSGTQSTKDGY